jgi:EmrB/QacA subfamily drug resistance transporter
MRLQGASIIPNGTAVNDPAHCGAVLAAHASVASPIELPPDLQTSHIATAPAGQLRIVMAGALLAMVLAALDQNIVNTALPRMASDLGGMSHLSWVVTAFMLTTTTTTPLYGKLSDIYGRRMLFFVAILIFLVGSLLCGTARSMGQIIAFRAIQGLGAGGLLVLAQAAIGDVVSPRDRPRYQGLFTGTFALSSVAGPLLGGLITSALSWRWVFYVNLPVGALALVMIAIGLRKPPSGKARPIDYAGALLLAGATAALLLLLAWGGVEFPWASRDSVGLVAMTATLIALFIWREGRAPEPLIRLPLFRNRVFARGVAVGGMMTFAMLGSTVFLPLYFQLVLGMDPAVAGAMMLPQVVGMLLTSVIGGRIVAKLGRNRPFLLAGLGLEAIALGSLAAFAFIGAPRTVFLISMAALGLGMGMGMPNLTTAVQNAAPHRELGAATGAMSFVRSLGGALGVAASGTIMSTRLANAFATAGLDVHALTEHRMALFHFTPAQQAAVGTAYRTALTGCFLLSGVVMTMAFALVLGLPEITLRSEIEETSAA